MVIRDRKELEGFVEPVTKHCQRCGWFGKTDKMFCPAIENHYFPEQGKCGQPLHKGEAGDEVKRMVARTKARLRAEVSRAGGP